MRYMIKLGEDTNYKDYHRMIENHELDDVITASMSIVDIFKERYPTVPIDEVQLVINKTGEITTDIKEVIVEHNMKAEEEGMPCFNCEAFNNDELCYNKRTSRDGSGIEGLECPRIKEMVMGA